MDHQSITKKILKYFIVFAIIYLATIYVPSVRMTVIESAIIAMIASILFAFLDMYYPSVIIEKRN